MSLQAELLRSLKAFKVMKAARKQRNISMAKMRRRLRLIEPFVPRPPAGTKTTIIDVAGIRAVETLVRQAHIDDTNESTDVDALLGGDLAKEVPELLL